MSAYNRWSEENLSFRKLYMLLDEGTLTFNADPQAVSVLIIMCSNLYKI